MKPAKKFPVRALAAVLAFAGLLLSGARLARAQSTVDPIFGGGSLGLSDSGVNAAALQADGKVLISGGPHGIVRLNPDGSVDGPFVPQFRGNKDSYDFTSAITVRPDGKILVGGLRVKTDDSLVSSEVVRLNPDGSLDTGGDLNVGQITTLVPQADGKTLVGSDRSSDGRLNVPGGLIRLNADGSPDPSFHPVFVDTEYGGSPAVRAILVQPDGKIVVGGHFGQVNGTTAANLVRLNPDGTVDPGFSGGTSGDVQAIVIQPDSQVIVAGGFYQVDGTSCYGIARLNPDGTLDVSFPSASGYVGSFHTAIPAPDGTVYASGFYGPASGTVQTGVIHFLRDGSVDAAFQATVGKDGSSGGADGIVLQPDGRIIVNGSFSRLNGTPVNSVGRLLPDGQTDTTFLVDQASGPNGQLDQLALQSDGKVVIGGTFTAVNGAAHNHLARLTASATPDTGFNADVDGEVLHVAVQPDGKILACGYFGSVNGVAAEGIARLNADGTLDQSFHPDLDDSVECMALQPDGKIVAGGYFDASSGTNHAYIARLNADGTFDESFHPSLTAMDNGVDVSEIALQPDGKIVIAGTFGAVNGVARPYLARLNADGALDAGFQPPVKIQVNTHLALQRDGRILVAGGVFESDDSPNQGNLSRLNADGSLDEDFTPHIQVDFAGVLVVVEQPDGKLLVGGNFIGVAGVPVGNLARLNANGSLDPYFGVTMDRNTDVSTLVLQPDGKILLGGYFSRIDGALRNYVARLTASGTPDFFGGGGAVSVGGGFYYMEFATGNPFGYYNLAGDGYTFPYLYHADLGMEYFFDAQDGFGGAYLYDFASGGFFYTSPKYAWPYLYDFSLKSVLYYYPDPANPGRYNTDGVRYFYNFATGQIITK